MKRCFFITVLFLLLFASKAFAGEFYIGPKVGAFFTGDLDDVQIVNYGNIANVIGEIDMDHSFDFGLKAGGTFGSMPDWLALELDIGYFNPKGDYKATASGTAFGGTVNIGKVADIKSEVIYASLNTIFQYPKGTVRPYVGGGLGLYNVDVELDWKPIGEGKESDSDRNLGYQALAGLKFKIPHAYLFTEAKFIYTQMNLFNRDIDIGGFEIVGGILFTFGSNK